MSHIAFFGLPFAGHVNPTLGVVTELAARGHRVSYAVPHSYTARVAAAGAHPVGYHTTLDDFATAVAPLGNPERYTSDSLCRVLMALLREAAASLPHLARAFADDRPDIVVYDAPSSWAGRLLASRWRIPVVRSRPAFAANAQWSLGGGYTAFTADPGLHTVVSGVARLLHRVGARTTIEEFFADGEDEPTLVYLPRAFQYAGDTFGPLTHFVGPCLRRGDDWAGWRPPDNGRPVVFATLGTVYNGRSELFRNIIEALGSLACHGVVTLGGADRTHLGPIPANVEVHDMVPYQAILAHARLLVSHAGMSTTMESLAAGVPVLALPQTAEHLATADRLVQLGLGRRLAHTEAGVESVREAVAALLLDDGTRARAQAMRAEIDAAGGAAAAADVVESLCPVGRR